MRSLDNSMILKQCMSSVHDPIAVAPHGAIVHVTLNRISVGFALESICRTMRVEIAKVLIISGDFWHFLGTGFVSMAINHVFDRDFCTIIECSITLGNSFH
jgi:hypothetical protein